MGVDKDVFFRFCDYVFDISCLFIFFECGF